MIRGDKGASTFFEVTGELVELYSSTSSPVTGMLNRFILAFFIFSPSTPECMSI